MLGPSSSEKSAKLVLKHQFHRVPQIFELNTALWNVSGRRLTSAAKEYGIAKLISTSFWYAPPRKKKLRYNVYNLVLAKSQKGNWDWSYKKRFCDGINGNVLLCNSLIPVYYQDLTWEYIQITTKNLKNLYIGENFNVKQAKFVSICITLSMF